jgi:CheY-like chemotaxis protein
MMIGYKVLVADDEPDIRNILRRLLISEGYCVCEAGNGLEAVSQAERCDINAIIMDITMPHLNGDEAVQRLRAKPEFTDTPILIITGNADWASRAALTRHQNTRLMTKPLNLAQVVTTVQQMVQTA